MWFLTNFTLGENLRTSIPCSIIYYWPGHPVLPRSTRTKKHPQQGVKKNEVVSGRACALGHAKEIGTSASFSHWFPDSEDIMYTYRTLTTVRVHIRFSYPMWSENQIFKPEVAYCRSENYILNRKWRRIKMFLISLRDVIFDLTVIFSNRKWHTSSMTLLPVKNEMFKQEAVLPVESRDF